MQPDSGMPPHPATDIAVIINAHAGGGHAEEIARDITAQFLALGLHATVTLARDGQHMIATAEAAVRDGIAKVAVGGGDGSVNAVAGVLAGTTTAFGVLPMGTLNHFAKDLQIPLALDQAIHTIATGHPVLVDTGEVNGVLFVNNSSLGLYPDIVHEREKQQSRLGRGKWLAFCWAAIGALRRYPFLNVRLGIDDQEHLRRTPFVFIGNNEYLMEGFNIGSRTNLRCGKLSLYVCHRTGRLGLLRLALHALFGRLHQASDFDMLTATGISIETHHRRIRVATDGEVNLMQTPLHYRIRPASLKVLVPAAAAPAT